MTPPNPQPDPPSSPPPPAPGGLEVAPGVLVPEAALRFQYARSGGPGGQNVNKVNSKAELWLPVSALNRLDGAAQARLRTLAGSRLTTAGEIHIAADTHRTQEQNRADALERLRQLIVEAMRVPIKRRKTRPTKASRRRRLEGKRHRGEIKSKRSGRVEE